jgi:hypothetical protein
MQAQLADLRKKWQYMMRNDTNLLQRFNADIRSTLQLVLRWQRWTRTYAITGADESNVSIRVMKLPTPSLRAPPLNNVDHQVSAHVSVRLPCHTCILSKLIHRRLYLHIIYLNHLKKSDLQYCASTRTGASLILRTQFISTLSRREHVISGFV